jgi:hypothetical protein
VGGGVHLDHVDMAAFGMMARQCSPSPVRGDVGRRFCRSCSSGAGQDARGRRLADAAHAGEHEGMRDAAGGEGVGEGAHHRLLADQVETNLAAEALKRVTGCDKINTAALGNIVRQMHIHVIARSEGDPNWPGAVWGYGPREPYRRTDLHGLIEKIRAAL